MASNIIKLIRRQARGTELEEKIHKAFMKRQGLMWKRPVMDEEISKIDTWLLQHKLPMDILISIWSRATFCEWLAYGDATAEQKHLMLLNLRECYREFQKLPQRVQEALFSIGLLPKASFQQVNKSRMFAWEVAVLAGRVRCPSQILPASIMLIGSWTHKIAVIEPT